MVYFPNRGPNILDIFITNRSCLVEECNIIGGINDHEAVFVTSAIIAQLHHPPKRFIYLWPQISQPYETKLNIYYLCEEFITM